MRVFNQEKTEELQTYDLEKGHLKSDKLFLRHVDAVEEQGHYETIREYENGGKDVRWVVDVRGETEHDEFEQIQVYVPYTQSELAMRQISELKQRLQKYKEDVEQVDLFGMVRADYAEKKQMCAEIVLQLRELEKNI